MIKSTLRKFQDLQDSFTDPSDIFQEGADRGQHRSQVLAQRNAPEVDRVSVLIGHHIKDSTGRITKVTDVRTDNTGTILICYDRTFGDTYKGVSEEPIEKNKINIDAALANISSEDPQIVANGKFSPKSELDSRITMSLKNLESLIARGSYEQAVKTAGELEYLLSSINQFKTRGR